MEYVDDIIELDDYQEQALSTDVYPDDKFNIGYKALGLCGEAGEVSDKIKKVFRDCDGKFDENKAHEIAKELGDVLWYLSTLAYKLGYNLSEIATMNIYKLRKRMEENKIHGNGDNR
jgi:NTP pyrophosphatase (non-canonical NTP hydrolase)